MNRNRPREHGGSAEIMRDMMTIPPRIYDDVDMAACCDDDKLPETALLSLLSDTEQKQVQAMTDKAERRHLAFRRCFQRVFLAKVLGWQGHIGDLTVEHGLDSPPKLPNSPALRLSFSSSGSTVVACASLRRFVGIDVERIRSISDAVGLSQRFFTPPEAQALRQLPKNAQDRAFLHYWTAKEAGLKAVGKGINSGLNCFVLTAQNDCYDIEYKGEKIVDTAWNLQYLEFPKGHLVAVIHRSATT
jgi:phosphopantetheine--protein transferase-like protein